jgi:hypothetical protein
MKRIISEHENQISETTLPITFTKNDGRWSIWYILFIALAPLYLLLLIGAIVLALVMLDRHFISLTNFLLQQKIFILIMILGVFSAIIVYAISVRYALKKIGEMRQNGHTRQANVGLLVLALVASIMILPVILALYFH